MATLRVKYDCLLGAYNRVFDEFISARDSNVDRLHEIIYDDEEFVKTHDYIDYMETIELGKLYFLWLAEKGKHLD